MTGLQCGRATPGRRRAQPSRLLSRRRNPWRRGTWIPVCLGLAIATGGNASLAGAEPAHVEDARRLNALQVIGSHNSYKQPIEPALYSLLVKVYPDAQTLAYGHDTITHQLDLGLRSLELDVYHDPVGGHYAKPLGLRLLSLVGRTPQPFDPAGLLARPGFKVMHDPDFDFRSSNLTLEGCLAELRRWSEAHPDHLPIIVTINPKEQGVRLPGTVVPVPFDADALARLDEALLTGLRRTRVVIPDDVRRAELSLEDSVLSWGWPTIEESRGRFLFLLDAGAALQQRYAQGHPSLRGRAMFAPSDPGTPEAAAFIVNDPITDGERIRELVRRGYLVRTRADAGTAEARTGSLARFQAAEASGAHIITTDYYVPDPRINPEYRIRFDDGGFARLNPVISAAPARRGARGPVSPKTGAPIEPE